MYTRVRIDSRGRIVIPKEFREILKIKGGEELILILKDNKIIVEKAEDPFKVLERILRDLTFNRKLRKVAEKEALRSIKGG